MLPYQVLGDLYQTCFSSLTSMQELEKALDKQAAAASSAAIQQQEKAVSLPCDLALKLLKDEGLNEDQRKRIEERYKQEIVVLSNLKSTKVLKRKDHDLPRSLLLVPSGLRKGVYVLLKTHGKSKERGIGSFGLVTDAIHLETGALKAFKSAKKDKHTEREIEFNKILSKYPRNIVTAETVEYVGDCTERIEQESQVPRKLNVSKTDIPKEKGVAKVGNLMDILEIELFDKIIDTDHPFKPTSDQKDFVEACLISEQISEALEIMHKEKIAHLDLKPENVLITDDGQAKLIDFGFSAHMGTPIVGGGTPGFIVPELFEAKPDEIVDANPLMDVWQLGCLFSEIFKSKWVERCEDIEKDHDWKIDNVDFEALKDECLPGRNNAYHPMHSAHNIIDKCLQLKPFLRPTAGKVVRLWKQLNAKLKEINT